MQTELRTRLLEDATVSGIVGNRISWGIRPQGEAYPSLVLVLVNDARPQTFTANIAARETVVQIDCYGRTTAEVASLREAVINCIVLAETVGDIEFQRAFVDVVRNANQYSETGRIYRDSIDARIWHRSTLND